MRRWIIGAGGAGAAAAGLLLLIAFHRPGPPAGENGIFSNDCCGTFQMADGRLILNGKPSVRYEVGRDGHGPYIVPRTYVGALADHGFEIDGTRPTTRLRLDRLPHPQKVQLFDGSQAYLFDRKAAPSAPPR